MTLNRTLIPLLVLSLIIVFFLFPKIEVPVDMQYPTQIHLESDLPELNGDLIESWNKRLELIFLKAKHGLDLSDEEMEFLFEVSSMCEVFLETHPELFDVIMAIIYVTDQIKEMDTINRIARLN